MSRKSKNPESVAEAMASFLDNLSTMCSKQATLLRSMDDGGPQKKRGKREKDPNAPKWARTGYQLFMQDK